MGGGAGFGDVGKGDRQRLQEQGAQGRVKEVHLGHLLVLAVGVLAAARSEAAGRRHPDPTRRAAAER
eukprot:scaffold6218_cov119-Isochrysis_galbana.AAC.4